MSRKLINLSSLTVGSAVIVHMPGGETRNGRVLSVDLKGERPIAVAHTTKDGDNEVLANFKADGSTSLDTYYIETAPKRTYKYENVYGSDLSGVVKGSWFANREDVERLRQKGRRFHALLIYVFEDGNLVEVQIERP